MKIACWTFYDRVVVCVPESRVSGVEKGTGAVLALRIDYDS